MFNITPLRDKIINLILNNPVPSRNTDIINPYLIFSITFFFSRFKSVVLEELYYKGLIELHGDVDLFIKAKSASDTKYLSISASLTQKGIAYSRLNMKNNTPVAVPVLASGAGSKSTLRIVR